MSRPRSMKSFGKVGFTIPGFAREFDLDENTVRRAVKRKEIATVPFAGLDRIPPAEGDRFREIFRPVKHEDETAKASQRRAAAAEKRGIRPFPQRRRAVERSST